MAVLSYALPTIFTLFVWWFSTGAILYLDKQPVQTHGRALLGASVLLLLAIAGLGATANDMSVAGAYCAFTCAVIVWGWQEMAFLMGFVTGPRRRACPADCTGFSRFICAAQTVFYHELALLASLVVVWLATMQGHNHVGIWTFAVLWVMRLSAKLNLFLGVRNRSEDFLPDQLRYLETYFARRSVNLLFPFSVTLASIAAGWGWMQVFAHQPDDAMATRMNFVCALLSLGILEHWFMVLPLPSAAMWSWAIPNKKVAHESIPSLLTTPDAALVSGATSATGTPLGR